MRINEEAFQIWASTLKQTRNDLTEGEEFESGVYGEHPITLNTSLYIYLPECEGMIISFGDLIELAQELKSAKFIANQECWTDKSVYVRVAEANDDTIKHLHSLGFNVEITNNQWDGFSLANSVPKSVQGDQKHFQDRLLAAKIPRENDLAPAS